MRRSSVLPILLSLLMAGGALEAQSTSAFDTRQRLDARLDSLQSVMARSGDDAEEARAAREIDRIENRLRRGDFQPGDVVDIQVRGDSSLTGEFVVDPARTLEMPTVENIDLWGVLYSEGEAHVRDAVSVYLRDPDIRVRITKRLAVMGEVSSPGFYSLSPSATIADAIDLAEGPTRNANLDQVQLRRGGDDVLRLDQAPLTDITLMQIGTQRGDQLHVPETSNWSLREIIGLTGAVAGLGFAIERLFF